jgi:hypothetical protein
VLVAASKKAGAAAVVSSDITISVAYAERKHVRILRTWMQFKRLGCIDLVDRCIVDDFRMYLDYGWIKRKFDPLAI